MAVFVVRWNDPTQSNAFAVSKNIAPTNLFPSIAFPHQ